MRDLEMRSRRGEYRRERKCIRNFWGEVDSDNGRSLNK